LEGDLRTLASYGEKGLLELIIATHTGMTTENFEQVVKNWFGTARHPRLNRSFTELIYQPQMMQWTASGPGKRMMLDLHHTDSVREWAYDRESPVGRLDKGLDEAIEKGWTVISMKDDWKVVYPFEIN
jgi:hypothetical protein